MDKNKLTTQTNEMLKTRALYTACATVVLALGLLSRTDLAAPIPLYSGYGGDTLWAMFVYLSLRILAPSLQTRTVLLSTLAFSYFIELSQLYHAPWIDEIRMTTLGALVLGYGFLWTNIICYSVGASFCALVEFILGLTHIKPKFELSEILNEDTK